MYAICKLNNSYSVCVLCKPNEFYSSIKNAKSPEWKSGAKVSHFFYGEGLITDISNHQVNVFFKEAKTDKHLKNFYITYSYYETPSEIDNLRLCN